MFSHKKESSKKDNKENSSLPTKNPKNEVIDQHSILQLQKSIGNQAVLQLLKSKNSMMKSQQNSPTDIVQRYQYINSDPPERRDSMIYGIYKTKDGEATGSTLYVGQALSDRDGQRFIEHTKDPSEKDRPWNVANGAVYGDDIEDWPYVPAALEMLKDVTKFETTAAEQYWYQNKGGKTDLYNKVQPMKNATFYNYKDIKDNYDPKNIGLNGNWEPKDD